MATRIAAVLKGNAGEHYVMAELLRRGIVAALTSRNSPDIDILASKGTESVRIRVKTSGEGAVDWVWGVTVPEWIKEKYKRRQELTPEQWSIDRKECVAEAVKLTPFRNVGETGDYIVLVALGDEVEFYILPTLDVQEILQRGFEGWVRTLGRRGERSVVNWQRRIGLDDTALTDGGRYPRVADTKDDWDVLWRPE